MRYQWLRSAFVAVCVCGLLLGTAVVYAAYTNGPATIVRDIWAGPSDSSPIIWWDLGPYIVFSGYENEFDRQRHFVAKPPQHNSQGYNNVFPYGAIAYAGGTYFSFMGTPELGRELYAVKPYQAPVLLKDIQVGSGSGIPSLFIPERPIVVENNLLYFIGQEQANGPFSYWKSDGTAAGTVKLFDLPIGMEGYNRFEFRNQMVLFYTDVDADYRDWWIIRHGELIKGIRTKHLTCYRCNHNYPDAIISIVRPDAFYGIQINQPENPYADPTRTIMKYPRDGSEPVALKYLPYGEWDERPFEFGNMMMFTGSDGKDGNLWVSDGTPEGTTTLASNVIQPFTIANGLLFFFHKDDLLADRELWRTDGTREGTFKLITSPKPNLDTSAIGTLGDRALVVMYTRMWVSDGTVEGTKFVAEFNDPAPKQIRMNGDHVYFTASTYKTGNEVWSIPLSALGASGTWVEPMVPTRIPAPPTSTSSVPTPQPTTTPIPQFTPTIPPAAPINHSVLLPIVIR